MTKELNWPMLNIHFQKIIRLESFPNAGDDDFLLKILDQDTGKKLPCLNPVMLKGGEYRMNTYSIISFDVKSSDAKKKEAGREHEDA